MEHHRNTDDAGRSDYSNTEIRLKTTWVVTFAAKIGGADALLISYAEHNGSYSAAYKNVFDWTSRIDAKVYQGKNMVILATSPGPGGGSNVLASAKASAPHFGAVVKGDLSVPSFYDVFDMETGAIHDAGIQKQLHDALASLE